MSTKDFTANVISASKVVPDGNFKDSKASGIWDINEALDLIKGGNWPNAANINPSAFVDALFSTFVYDGTSDTSLAINNDLDLTKGGLVWTKERSSTGGGGNILFSTDASGNHSDLLRSNGSTAAGNGYQPDYFTFRNNGYTTTNTVGDTKVDGREYVSWSFRNQPKFFDIVTYTGNGSNRTIAHSLGSDVGMLIVKRLDSAKSWAVFHRQFNGGSSPANYWDQLNNGQAIQSNSAIWNNTAPTSSVFSVGTANAVNENGGTYVAYLFAHNNDDGGFGEPGDQDIIKCGYYAHPNDTSTVSVNLGFEPQWILLKANQAKSWYLFDVMRGIVTGGLSGDGDAALFPNTTDAENVNTFGIDVTSTGFDVAGNNIGSGGNNVVYMAIRRGGMQTPTTASSVFAIDEGDSSGAPEYTSGFPVDMAIKRNVSDTDNWRISARLIQGINHYTNTTAADDADDKFKFDYQNGYYNDSQGGNNFAWMWKRARGYFDVVAYSGTGSATTVAHNLGVAPEMMWIKRRDATGFWSVYHKGVNGGSSPEDYYVVLHDTTSAVDSATIFNDTAPTSSVFSVGTHNRVNNSSGTYIAYLFATVAGVSKVGSFTMVNSNGSLDVDCGFTNGSKFIILRRTDDAGHWLVVDTDRGITSGNDPYLRLDVTNAQNSSTELVNALSAGFTVQHNQGVVDGDYIFYAIATDPS